MVVFFTKKRSDGKTVNLSVLLDYFGIDIMIA